MKQTTILVTENEAYRLLRALTVQLKNLDVKAMGVSYARARLELWFKLHQALSRLAGHADVLSGVPPCACELIYDALLPKHRTKKAERATHKQAATRGKRQPAPARTADPVSEAVAEEQEARARARRGRERAARTLETQAPADPIPSAS